MSSAFEKVGGNDIVTLVRALESGRLVYPYSILKLSRFISGSIVEQVHKGMSELYDSGFTAGQIAVTLEMLLGARGSAGTYSLVDLVTSGPDVPGVADRDTAVVVREMFAHARKSVLLVGYVVYQGQRVFDALARNMEENPDLEVRMFLDITRGNRDSTLQEILVAQFAHRFRTKQWPAGYRLPDVYYDPRSLSEDLGVRSALHAKCVVVDERQVFVSSANFTEAAQQRNIEVGLRLENSDLARQLVGYFSRLQEHGLVVKAI